MACIVMYKHYGGLCTWWIFIDMHLIMTYCFGFSSFALPFTQYHTIGYILWCNWLYAGSYTWCTYFDLHLRIIREISELYSCFLAFLIDLTRYIESWKHCMHKSYFWLLMLLSLHTYFPISFLICQFCKMKKASFDFLFMMRRDHVCLSKIKMKKEEDRKISCALLLQYLLTQIWAEQNVEHKASDLLPKKVQKRNKCFWWFKMLEEEILWGKACYVKLIISS